LVEETVGLVKRTSGISVSLDQVPSLGYKVGFSTTARSSEL